MKKIGLIVNPIAGMGGSTGLKGTDGMIEEALRRGARPSSPARAAKALEALKGIESEFILMCAAGPLGEEEAVMAGLSPQIIDMTVQGNSEDTRELCREFIRREADAVIFAGGDGTARDVLDIAGDKVTVIGIPAGVKIHSAVFAQKPEYAGIILRRFITGELRGTRLAEVMDIDEELYRQGAVSSRLYGYMKVPFDNRLLQGKKSGSQPSEAASQQSIAWDITDSMQEDTLYLVGPGSTTSHIMKTLNLPYTLIGIDAVMNRSLVAEDLSEKDILRLIEDHPGRKIKLILTPIGGQGIILGRGNQQISSRVLEKIDRDDIIIAASRNKLAELRGRPFILDTGDRETDERLSGYLSIVTGYREYVVYRAE